MLIACKTTQEDWYTCLFLKLLCYKCRSNNLLVKILYQLHCFRLFQSSHVVAVCTVRQKQRVSPPQTWQVLEVLESPRNHHPLGDRTPDATCLANCEAKSACQIWSLYNERHNWTGTHNFTQQERTEIKRWSSPGDKTFTPATGNTHISKDSWVWVCRMASCPFLPWSLQ